MSQQGIRIDEALLGFDAREMFLDGASTWPAARRAQYLLRDDVARPKSVDTAVWPNIFGDGLPEDIARTVGLPQVPLPAWRGPNRELWDDLTRLAETLGPLANHAHRIVAVAWASADGFSKHASSGAPYREKTVPDALGPEWRLLGFDVADAYFTSGLSNCGYTESERTSLRPLWAGRLNEHHLFVDVRHALAFCGVAESRAPEHAPFLVYAIRALGDGSE